MGGESFFAEQRQGTPEQEASWAKQVAAQNLLDKLTLAIEAGDEPRARRLAHQAAALPFDDHEEVWPGVFRAGQGLFEDVSDMVEDWPQEDASWIEVLADALETADGWARTELLHVVGVLSHDAGLLEVTEREAARLKRLTAGTELDLEGPSSKVPEDERDTYVLEVVRLGTELVEGLFERLEQV